MERQLLDRQQVGEIKLEEPEATLLSPRNRQCGRERPIAAGQGVPDGDLPGLAAMIESGSVS
jgi:hypothetical protein